MALRGGGDAAAPGPAQLFGALVDHLDGGGAMCPCPAPQVSSLRVCRDEISTIRRRIATGAYYALVHIRRHPARLGEIMEVRPDESAIVRRVRRGASDVAGSGTDTGAGRPDVTGHVGAPRLVCARRTGGSAMRTLMESLKLLLAK